MNKFTWPVLMGRKNGKSRNIKERCNRRNKSGALTTSRKKKKDNAREGISKEERRHQERRRWEECQETSEKRTHTRHVSGWMTHEGFEALIKQNKTKTKQKARYNCTQWPTPARGTKNKTVEHTATNGCKATEYIMATKGGLPAPSGKEITQWPIAKEKMNHSQISSANDGNDKSWKTWV